jgi:CheY-like chemotaxis protein
MTTTENDMLKNLRILLVEDAFDLHYVFKIFLEYQGACVLGAKSAAEAVSLAHSGPYDFILMDMQLEASRGIDAINSIRSFDRIVPICAMTAYGQVAEKNECILAGCVEYLEKPIDLERLLSIISQQRTLRSRANKNSYC